MYTCTSNEDLIDLRVQNLHQLDEQLDQAVDVLAERARLRGDQGILVTRHSPQDFTLQLHADIPYGTIQERQEW